MSSTIAEVPKEPTFKLPEGRFKAVISQYKVKPGEKTSTGTILFDVKVPGMENSECIARKVMPVDLKAGSCMRRFIEDLLGVQYFKTRSNQAIDLRTVLVGQACEVELIHAKHDEDRFDWPLVEVVAMHPARPEPGPEKEAEPKN